ncbi:hypothetical protein [uncultured Acinetobacter sp.]|nr:hypothetical protein [uncultured Acinetobacter sp.]
MSTLARPTALATSIAAAWAFSTSCFANKRALLNRQWIPLW